MSLITQINALATKCAQEDQSNAAAAAAALAAAQAAQATADSALNIGGAAYHYKGTVADLTALNAVANPEVGDVYNVGSDLDGGNYAYNGTSWDSLGKAFTVAQAISSSSGTGLVPEGLVKDALDLKEDAANIGDTTTDFVATYTAAYAAAAAESGSGAGA